MELTPAQIRILERLHSRQFEIVAFPMYAECVGVRRGNCAVLLASAASDTFTLYGQPIYMVAGNLSARVKREDGDWFVWKKDELKVTPERLSELQAFSEELAQALLPVV